MQLPLQDFGTLVKTQAAAVSNSCRQLIDMSVGSVMRAILEANASVGLWVQWLILQVLALTRAATSSGADLDSWIADFGMARLPASVAGGQVRFSRVTAGLPTVVAVGSLVRTGTDANDQVFAVAEDPENALWTGAGYQVSAAALSVVVPVVAKSSGASGNVRPGTVVQIASVIPGMDSVVNDAPMSGGLDAESDTAVRARFSDFLDSRTRATAQAVGFAIASVQQGISFTIAECVDSAGAARAGHFTVTVDDGTGAPATGLIAKVAAAVEIVRPIGSTFSVRAPIIVPVDVSATVSGTFQALSAAQAAVSIYISTLPIGASLIISKLYQVIHDADIGISSILSLTINSTTTDVSSHLFDLIRPGQVTVKL